MCTYSKYSYYHAVTRALVLASLISLSLIIPRFIQRNQGQHRSLCLVYLFKKTKKKY